MNGVAHIVGKSIYGLRGCDECFRTFVLDPSSPGSNRIGRNQESSCRFPQRPAPSGPKLQNRHSFPCRIVRTPRRRQSQHPRIFDPHFVLQQAISCLCRSRSSFQSRLVQCPRAWLRPRWAKARTCSMDDRIRGFQSCGSESVRVGERTNMGISMRLYEHSDRP